MAATSPTHPIYAAIDAGGTTFKCGLYQEGVGLIANLRVPTQDPKTTLAACSDFFKTQQVRGHIPAAMGIASFGPIDINAKSETYGLILDGPKMSWSGTNLRTYFQSALSVPVSVDTDVNGALLAEMAWGAAQETISAAYVTIGTGIGAGFFANGRLIGAPNHPEFGHIAVQRHSEDRHFLGVCQVHGDCLEGLASATAVTERFGDPRALGASHIAWEIEAFYLAQCCRTIALAFRPERIVLGGGVMLAPHLLGQIRDQYHTQMQNYLGQSFEDIERLIVTPGLGDDAGLMGGVRLAQILDRAEPRLC